MVRISATPCQSHSPGPCAQKKSPPTATISIFFSMIMRKQGNIPPRHWSHFHARDIPRRRNHGRNFSMYRSGAIRSEKKIISPHQRFLSVACRPLLPCCLCTHTHTLACIVPESRMIDLVTSTFQAVWNELFHPHPSSVQDLCICKPLSPLHVRVL